MARIRLRGIPAKYAPGTQIIQEGAGGAGASSPVTFVVDEDGFGYAEVDPDLAARMSEGCAEIEIVEDVGARNPAG